MMVGRDKPLSCLGARSGLGRGARQTGQHAYCTGIAQQARPCAWAEKRSSSGVPGQDAAGMGRRPLAKHILE